MKNFDPNALKTGMLVLEASLIGETWFIEEIQNAAVEFLRSKPGKEDADLSKDDFPTLASGQGYKHLTSLARFYFALHALDCTSEDQIGNLIRHHNEKLDDDVDELGVSKRELTKARFSDRRAKQVIETIKFYNSPVFAVSELSSLLFNLMAPRTTETLVMDLLHGGIMVQRGLGQEDIPTGTDPRRVLVEPAEMFVETYIRSLALTHERILEG